MSDRFRGSPGLPRRALAQFRLGWDYARIVAGAPVAPESAAHSVRRRLTERTAAFLDTVHRAVLAYPESPYARLLSAAGYDGPRLDALMSSVGLERGLQELAAGGVYVSVEEFKGLREVRRGSLVFTFDERSYSNPLVRAGLVASSGGTRSRGLRTTISPSNHRMGAEHLAVALDAYGLWVHPVIVYLPSAHGASLWAVLALAAMGKNPRHWFSQFPMPPAAANPRYPFTLGIWAWTRVHRRPIPAPRHTPLGDEGVVLRWIATEGARGCGIFTTPSTALRIALAARRDHRRLDGVRFITIGEPLTPAKAAAVTAAGAQAYSSLGFTEFGRATYGCADPGATDETHVCSDAVAVISRRRLVDRWGTAVDALLFTSIWPDARRVMINTETGDYAAMASRPCGCPLYRLGWTSQLAGIRSFEKLNAEGRLFFGSQLITLVEEGLPARFGGDPDQYQLIEQEDPDGFTRLSVLVDPQLGPVDEDAVLRCVETALDSLHPRAARIWQVTNTVRVVRASPVRTRAGKLMPLHHLGVEETLAFEAGVNIRA